MIRTPLSATLLSAAAIGLAAAIGPAAPAVAAAPVLLRTEQATARLVEVTRGLSHPWGMAFLPDGGILVTERPGRLRLVRDGALDPRPIEGVPPVVARGQGGLLDVALHPDFATNRLVYLSLAGPAPGGALTRVVRGRLDGHRLAGVETIFEAPPATGARQHFGSRLLFDRAGRLYVTLGERGDGDRAQDRGDAAGSVVRLTADGAPAPGNPFAGRAGARPEIFTWGHRNAQGMDIHPETGAVWVHEHGPLGGDEVNILEPGANYGWPVITYGRAYSGLPIGEGTSKPGMKQPIHTWVPSIAPSGMAFYTGPLFPAWQGDLFVGALKDRLLARLELDGDRVVGEERLLVGRIGRIRDVTLGPDGFLYLLTDEGDGGLYRLEPASS